MALLQYASCLDNSNHTGAGRALLPIWTLSCCQSAQKIVRYPDGCQGNRASAQRIRLKSACEQGACDERDGVRPRGPVPNAAHGFAGRRGGWQQDRRVEGDEQPGPVKPQPDVAYTATRAISRGDALAYVRHAAPLTLEPRLYLLARSNVCASRFK